MSRHEHRQVRRNGRPVPRPILKWVGGKSQLVPHLLAHAPDRFRRFHEPFAGGAALFFALQRARRLGRFKAELTDLNDELITTYRAVRDDVDGVMAVLARHHHDRDHYYAVRAQDPAALAPAARAARMIFLNRTGYNGLYRVNRQGKFNVPFGRHTNPLICDGDNLPAAARALRRAWLRTAPFESVLDRAAPGDLVYFDPPYVPLSATASFVGYGRDGFGPDDQARLAEVFAALAHRGVHVMLSNSDTPDVRRLYRGFPQVRVRARRAVNSKAAGRGPVGELIVLSGEAASRE